VTPWAVKTKTDTDFQSNGTQMAFNTATWSQ
jgi:hypothetical protein